MVSRVFQELKRISEFPHRISSFKLRSIRLKRTIVTALMHKMGRRAQISSSLLYYYDQYYLLLISRGRSLHFTLYNQREKKLSRDNRERERIFIGFVTIPQYTTFRKVNKIDQSRCNNTSIYPQLIERIHCRICAQYHNIRHFTA